MQLPKVEITQEKINRILPYQNLISYTQNIEKNLEQNQRDLPNIIQELQQASLKKRKYLNIMKIMGTLLGICIFFILWLLFR